MPIDPRLPVLVGVGQVVHHAAGLADGREPVDLMAAAVRAAAADAGLADVPAPDSIRVVDLLTWHYGDPGRLVAQALSLDPRETVLTTAGGNSPQTLLNATAAEIQRGELDLAVLTGGESWRTAMRARRQGVALDWRTAPDGAAPTRRIGAALDLASRQERELGVGMPIVMFPILETAVRAHRREPLDAHLVRISELWSRFSSVAAKNPYAWSPHERTAAEIRTPGPSNRMVDLPYPKYMNANNDVDMAAALIVCSLERARSLGVADDRIVFIHAGTDCHDILHVSNRPELHSSPAVRLGGARALALAGLGIDDVDVIDLYSCFPAAVEIGAGELGLSLDRQLTRTGGLSFAGGPWNNYAMHAIATVVADLRERPGEPGFVWANGGYVAKHAFGVYATAPPPHGFRHESQALQAAVDALPRCEVADGAGAAGPATVTGYTVSFSRSGAPERGWALCRTADGRHAWGTAADGAGAAAMTEGEWVGRRVELAADGTIEAAA